MVSLDDAVIARLKTHGEVFEILVDPDLALKYKEGENVNINELLAINNIFKDAKAGDKASEQLMSKIFGTTDVLSIVDRILKKGEVHLTIEQRKTIMGDKRRRIITIIARNAINPQTNTPHPATRIEKAMDEAKVSINMTKSAEGQIDEVLKAIRPIIPIKFATLNIAIMIPAQYAGGCHGVLKEFGEVKKEEWNKGDLLCSMEIPAGLQDELYNKLNKMTHGEVKTKVLK
jgi:ribosome maturation protein SDO1